MAGGAGNGAALVPEASNPVIRTLDRMVGSSFTGLYLLFVVCIPAVFIISDLNERLDIYLDRDVGMAEIALGCLFQYPHFMVWSTPLAGLVAAVFTVQSMTTHREIQAAKGGGVSFHRLVLPIWLVGAVMTVGAFFLGVLVPTTNRMAAETLGEREVRREWRNDFVFQTENGETLTIRQLYLASQSMDGLLMESQDDEGTLRHVWARQAFWEEGAGWTLHDGYLRLIRPGGNETTYAFQRYRPAGLAVSPEGLLEEPREEEEMSYHELGRLAAMVDRSGGDARELLVKQQQKLAIPATTLVIVLFGTPLATTAKKGGAAFGIGVSLGSTIVFMTLMRLFGAIGTSGGLSPWWAAWTPNLLFLAAALILQVRVRT